MSELTGIAKLGCPYCKRELAILSDRMHSKEPATREEWLAVMACPNPHHGEFTYHYYRHFGHAQDGDIGQGEEYWFLEYDYSEKKFFWRDIEDSEDDDDSDYDD